MKTRTKYIDFVHASSIILGLAIFSSFFPNAFQISNLKIYIHMIVPYGIMAIGLYPVMIAGYIDLSQFAIAGFTGAMVALAANSNGPILPILILGILFGCAIGAINGWIIIKLKVHPILTTYGMSLVIKGIMFVATKGRMVSLFNKILLSFGRQSLLGIPYPVYFLILIFFLVMYLIYFSVYGRKLLATGVNERASYFSGISVEKVQMIAFMLSGTCAAISGIIMVSINASVSTGLNLSINLSAIIILVLGGTDFRNIGSPIGLLTGMILFAIMEKGLIFMGIADYYHLLIKGGLLLLIIMYNNLLRTALSKTKNIKAPINN